MKIDIHAHFYPQEYWEEISRLGAASTDPFARGWYGQMAGLCRCYPNRFRAFACLPMLHPEAALEELGRATKNLGLHRIILMDYAYQIRPICRQHISRPPSHYLKSMYVDGLSFHGPALRCAYETLGPEHLLLGSDHPFPLGGVEQATRDIKALGLTEREERMIFGGNAARLLGITSLT